MRYIDEIVNRQINRWNNITALLHYVPGQTTTEQHPARAASGIRHPVICISRELGSGAFEVGRSICDRLGYELFDSKLIDEIAKDLHVQRKLVESLDEHGRNDLELMIESFLRGREIETREYLASLMRITQTLAIKGGVVILGRGATFVLKDQAALNVLLIAPLELRIRRLMAYENLDEHAAREKVLSSDRQREWFVRKCFNTDIHNPAHFDLTINTARINLAEASELVFAGLEARGFALDQLAIPLASH